MNKSSLSFLNKYGIVFVLIALVVYFSIASASFMTFSNIMNVMRQVSMIGITSVGMMFVILTGGIDLSVGSVMSFVNVVAAFLMVNFGWHPVMAVIACVMLSATAGLISGFFITKVRVPPFIATLGSMLVTRAVAQIYTNAFPVPMLTPEFLAIGRASWVTIPYVVSIPNVIMAFLIVLVLGGFLLTQTRYGKNIYAIGGNEMAARVAGINVERNLIKVYVFSSLCAALAGVLLAARAGSGNSTLGINFELDAIAAATVGGVSHSGGVARISGVIAGILLLGVVNNGLLLLGISPYYQNVVRGVIIVGAVVFDMRKNAKRA